MNEFRNRTNACQTTRNFNGVFNEDVIYQRPARRSFEKLGL